MGTQQWGVDGARTRQRYLGGLFVGGEGRGWREQPRSSCREGGLVQRARGTARARWTGGYSIRHQRRQSFLARGEKRNAIVTRRRDDMGWGPWGMRTARRCKQGEKGRERYPGGFSAIPWNWQQRAGAGRCRCKVQVQGGTTSAGEDACGPGQRRRQTHVPPYLPCLVHVQAAVPGT